MNTVYAIYDVATRRLLYIGMTRAHLFDRLTAHIQDCVRMDANGDTTMHEKVRYFKRVHAGEITVGIRPIVVIEDRKQAEAIECAFIEVYRPPFNTQHLSERRGKSVRFHAAKNKQVRNVPSSRTTSTADRIQGKEFLKEFWFTDEKLAGMSDEAINTAVRRRAKANGIKPHQTKGQHGFTYERAEVRRAALGHSLAA